MSSSIFLTCILIWICKTVQTLIWSNVKCTKLWSVEISNQNYSKLTTETYEFTYKLCFYIIVIILFISTVNRYYIHIKKIFKILLVYPLVWAFCIWLLINVILIRRLSKIIIMHPKYTNRWLIFYKTTIIKVDMRN